MTAAVVRRWTEITMVPVGFSCGLCLMQVWLFYEYVFIRLEHFEYLSIDPDVIESTF